MLGDLGKPPTHIMSIIQGYRIPFITTPPLRKISRLPQFPVDSSAEMLREIDRMIDQGIIEPAPDQVGFESHLFLVEKQNGSFRPVLNLKGLNRYLGKEYFRLTSMHKVPSFLQPRDWMCKVDLHQAYFHVPVAESHRRFLRFAAVHQGQLRYWQMTCLPFGLASAPRVFASLSNWVAHQLRLEGIRLLVYLDDFLLVSQCPHTLQKQVQRAVNLLQHLGWVINMEKSSTNPSQSLEFLGIQWDTRLNQKSLPEKKLHALELCLHRMDQTVIWTPLSLQQLVGRLNFSSFVIPFGRFNHRNLLSLMQISVRNCVSIPPTKAALADLHWWKENFQKVSDIWPNPVSHFIVTDASNLGWERT
ncbi:reverse transcriptase (RNA-dependent DNA polymerase) domain-containing protein [Phthorimaea operculella]|nr:reverse transcriptase (RNA-dependent DNA polymerase) domain-containing protein [Phthorimaea operculella]